MAEELDTSAAKGAIALGLSVFVGITAIFVAIMAFAIAPLQARDVGLAGGTSGANDSARAACYAIGVAALAVGFLALYRGRKNFALALLCTVLFLAGNVALGLLYVRTW